MKKASKYLFLLLKNTFIITVICLLLALLGGDGSLFEGVFGTIGLFAAILTINLFYIHVIVVIIAAIFKKNDTSA
jgi:hypothetical protein